MLLDKNNLLLKIQWAEDYIKDFNKKETFSPFIFTADPVKARKQKLYIDAVIRLHLLNKKGGEGK